MLSPHQSRTRIAIAFICLLSAKASGQLVTYSFGAPSPLAATSSAANVVPGLINFTGSNASQFPFSSLLALNVASGATDAATAVANDSYFQFTIAPAENFQLSLSSVGLLGARGYPTAGAGFAVRTSADGFVAELSNTLHTTHFTTQAPYSVDLSGAQFQNLTAPLTVRFYVYDLPAQTSASQTVDNLVMNGSVTAVPEPSTIGMLGMAVGIAGWSRRRRSAGTIVG